MIRVTYTIYSKLLEKTFTNTEDFKSMADWSLWNMALFYGEAVIVKQEQI